MAEQAMLDVSMIAHRGSLKKMMAMARENPESLSGLVVSAAFVEKLSRAERDGDEIVKLIAHYFEVPRHLIDRGLMREFILSESFQSHVRPYKLDLETVPPEYRQLQLQIDGEDRWVTQVMIEEWEFLMTHSWLFAKTRAIYDRIVNAGGKAFYVTKEKLEHAVRVVKDKTKAVGHTVRDATDPLVARTVKKLPGQEVSPNDRVRALAKWVAVGGGATAGLMVPIGGAALAGVSGLFLLYDP